MRIDGPRRRLVHDQVSVRLGNLREGYRRLSEADVLTALDSAGPR
jgi:hypothetical protein